MAKQPTYVWIVEEDNWEDTPQGVVGVYARKADAVKQVRAMRRDYCAPDGSGLDDDERIRLKDWEVKDRPHEFSMTCQTLSIFLRAYRVEVR
jgi:hypothetical protein